MFFRRHGGGWGGSHIAQQYTVAPPGAARSPSERFSQYSSAPIHLPTSKNRMLTMLRINNKTRLSQNGEKLRRENKRHILVLMPFFCLFFMQTQFSHWSPFQSVFKGSAPTVHLRRTPRTRALASRLGSCPSGLVVRLAPASWSIVVAQVRKITGAVRPAPWGEVQGAGVLTRSFKGCSLFDITARRSVSGG